MAARQQEGLSPQISDDLHAAALAALNQDQAASRAGSAAAATRRHPAVRLMVQDRELVEGIHDFRQLGEEHRCHCEPPAVVAELARQCIDQLR